MNKKGSFSVLVTMIIFITVAIFIIFILGKLTIIGKDTAGTQGCRKCIELGNIQDKISVTCECYEEELLIKYKDVVEGGVINQNKAHQIIANAMYDTFYKYHGGMLDPAPEFKDTTEEGICYIFLNEETFFLFLVLLFLYLSYIGKTLILFIFVTILKGFNQY